MYIQHNMTAAAANRFLKQNTRTKLKCMEKLSSGYRLNRAADDAAGLVISEKMRAQIRGLGQGERNVQDGIGFVKTADGALSEIQSMMHRMHELAVQAANDTNTAEDRKALDMELQQYKNEIDDIFKETEFNTIKIWDTNTNHRVQIGVEPRQALQFVRHSGNWQHFRVTEVNKGAIAYSGYTIEVQGTDKADSSTYGFRVKWEGYNKKQYTSELISWNASKLKNFSVNIKDYLDTAANPELAGMNFKIEWNAVEAATLEDVAESVNGVSLSSYISSSESITPSSSGGVHLSVSTNYLAELASGRDVDHYDTKWIEPALKNGSNVISSPSYNNIKEDKGWKFQFNMPGIGTVTATSSSVRYWGRDDDADAENIWWYWSRFYHQKTWYTLSPSKGSNGTLLGVTDCMTESRTNGLRNTKKGGEIIVSFDMESNKNFNYQGRTSSDVGTITMTISVKRGETEKDIMDKLKGALSGAVIDVYEGNQTSNTPSTTTAYANDTSAKSHIIDTPIYKTNHDRVIQAGANAGQLIHICYESLRLMNLGIQNSNVLTGENATQSISEIQSASKMISEQRSLFGSYQNRLEHAEAVDAETAENLQAAESRIRDADMADEMLINARNVIIGQSMQAMLANANQQPEGVLALLQG